MMMARVNAQVEVGNANCAGAASSTRLGRLSICRYNARRYPIRGIGCWIVTVGIDGELHLGSLGSMVWMQSLSRIG